MELKNGFPNPMQLSKDLMTKDTNAVDPKVNSEEQASSFTYHSFFHNTFSRNNLKLSTITDIKVQIQERAKCFKTSRVITFILILTIIGVFSIPVILYHDVKTNPIPESNNAFTDVNISMSSLIDCPNITIEQSECTEDVIYTYESLKVASVFTNQFCPNGTYPLFCKALELCSSGQDVIVQKLLCTLVRQKLCTAEWRILEVNNRSEELIDCQGLGETSQPNCHEQFDLADNNSVCLPLCKEFSQYAPRFTDALVGTSGIGDLVNVIGGIIAMIACILNRAKMFMFPQILTLLNICMLTSVSFIIMLSNISMGSWNPICSHKFLTGHLKIVGTLDEPSTFCQIQGFIIFAGFVTYSLYWLLYAFHLYLKVAQPKCSKLLDSWHYTKKFYYLEVGLVTIIGAIPYLVLAGLSEFQINQFPPLFCGLSAAGSSYGIVIPTIVVNCATVIILLLVLYHVHNHMGIFKKSESSWLCQITAPEVKIFLIFCYQLLFLASLWSSLTHAISKHDETAIAIGSYLWCSINGVHDQLDCEQYRKEFEDLSIPELYILNLLLLSFLNISNLPLIIEYKSVKNTVLSILGRDSVKETDIQL